MLKQSKQALAEELFQIGAIKFGAFRMKLHDKNPNAPLSPIYIDLRILRSFPRAMALAVEQYLEIIKGLRFDMLADVPTAATPIVAILSSKLQVPMISPRKDDKEHGIQRKIDGVFQPGQVALVVDDLITQAESKFEAIAVLETNKLVVKDVVVLVDREQGGAGQIAARGYSFHTALKLGELLAFYRDSGKIAPDKYESTVAYLKGAAI